MRRPKGPTRKCDRWIATVYRGLWVLWRIWKWYGISLPLIKRSGEGQYLSVDSFTTEEKQGMKRPEVMTDKIGGGSVDLPISKLLKQLDRLNDLLCSGSWDDGALKGQRSLMLFAEGAMVRVIGKVESPPLKLTAVGRSLDEALVALDALLGASDVPWEMDIPRGEKPFRKKK